ncbi:Periplasmic protein involved in polysaccharide export (plasmid) [Rhodovulum sp. P5]|uniref:polysaccharide biosynthesis/export family protein n=1 Tax=Rhodovulum sp. P5 TaxID=1564506 RepID=UPI0009C226B6|nr:polysaccharide biosynthesis/export family protein [Rhodovulum sp. P5]ARE42509.1 Periplasmic protein involved in polysaccharide export [Rhodovulum sp. P5]
MALFLKRIVAGLMLVLAAAAAQAQEQYRVKPGDVLSVEVLEDNSLNRSLVVLPDGRISFPFAGSLVAAGRTVGQIESAITSAISGNFTITPNVFVAVQPATDDGSAADGYLGPVINVYFLGEVGTPGLREVEKGTTFLQALSLGGGLTNFAATKRIQLRRADPKTGAQKVYQIDYHAIMRGATMARDITLRDGDVILVPERRLFE